MRNLRKDFLKLSILSLAFILFVNISVVFADTVVTNPDLPRFAQSNILMSTIAGKGGRITVGLDYQLCGTGKGYDYKDITKITMSCNEYDPNVDPNSYPAWGTFPETEVTYTILENLNLIHIYEDLWAKCSTMSDFAAYGKNYKLNVYFGEESISCPVNVIQRIGEAPKHTGFCVVTMYDPFVKETNNSLNIFSNEGSVNYNESERQSYINMEDLAGKSVYLNTNNLGKKQISGIFLENYKTDEEITLFSNGGVRIDESTVVPSIRQYDSFIKNNSTHQHPKIMYNGNEYFAIEGENGTIHLGETGYACDNSIISFTDAESLTDTSNLYTRPIKCPVIYGDENFYKIVNRLITKFPQYGTQIFLGNVPLVEVNFSVMGVGGSYEVLTALGDTISLGFEKYSDVPSDLKEELKAIEAEYNDGYSYTGQFLYKKYNTEVMSLGEFRSEVAAGTLTPENVMDIDITSGFDLFTGDNINDLYFTIFEDENFDPVSSDVLEKVSSIVYNKYSRETLEFVREYLESNHSLPEVLDCEVNKSLSGTLKFTHNNLVALYSAIYNLGARDYSNLRDLVKSKIVKCINSGDMYAEVDFETEVKTLNPHEKILLELYYDENESNIFNYIKFKYDLSNPDNFSFFADAGTKVNCYAEGVLDYEEIVPSVVSRVWDDDNEAIDSKYNVNTIARLKSNNNTRILDNSFVEKGYSVKAYGYLFKDQLLNPACNGYVTVCRNMYFGEGNYPLFNPTTSVSKSDLGESTYKLYARGSILDSLYCRQNPKSFIFAEPTNSELIKFSADGSYFTFTDKVSELLDKGTSYKLIVQYSSDVEDDTASPFYTAVPGIQFAVLEITEGMLSDFQEKAFTEPYSSYKQDTGDIIISRCYYDVPYAMILPASVPGKATSLAVSDKGVLTWTNTTDEGLGDSGKDEIIKIESIQVKLTPLNSVDVEEAIPEPGVTINRAPNTNQPVVIDLPAGTTSVDIKNYLSPGVNYLIDITSKNKIGTSETVSFRYNSVTPSTPSTPSTPQNSVTITVRDHFDTDVTDRVTVNVKKGDPYFFKSLEKKGWKVVGKSSYSGTVDKTMVLDFFYEKETSSESRFAPVTVRGDLCYSDGTPMRDVKVELEGENKSTISDTLGHFEIGGLGVGTHIVNMTNQSGELIVKCKVIVNSNEGPQASLISKDIDYVYIDFVGSDVVEIDGNQTVTQSSSSSTSPITEQPAKKVGSASATNATNVTNATSTISDDTKTGDSNMTTVLVFLAFLSLGSVALILTLNKKAKVSDNEE